MCTKTIIAKEDARPALRQRRGKAATATEITVEGIEKRKRKEAISLCESKSKESAIAAPHSIASASLAAAVERMAQRAKALKKPSYTMAEVSQHRNVRTSRDGDVADTWIVYESLVLDVSNWTSLHPGGTETILRFAGGDATDEIRSFHPPQVLEKRLGAFVVGTVSDAPEPTGLVSDFRELGKEFEMRGYYESGMSYYWFRLATFLTILACVWVLVFMNRREYDPETKSGHSFGLTLVAGFFLAAFWQQMAFVGHDCGHLTTHYDSSKDLPFGYVVANTLTGISLSWWKSTHNVHHAVPNTVDCDPDIALLPAIAIDEYMFNSLYNKFHKRLMTFDWAARKIFVPHQHLLYYPIMCVARFNLIIQGLIHLAKEEHVKNRGLELALMAFYVFWLSTLVWFVPGGVRQQTAFVLFSHAIAGLLNVQITLSHFSREVFTNSSLDTPLDPSPSSVEKKSMDDVDNKPALSCDSDDGDSISSSTQWHRDPGPRYGGDFYTRNIGSSLDVECPPSIDWFHGGLQFQTIHHLYPRVGRRYLRSCQEEVRTLCRTHGLNYEAKSFLDCNYEVYQHLKDKARLAGEWSPVIWDTMCAHG